MGATLADRPEGVVEYTLPRAARVHPAYAGGKLSPFGLLNILYYQTIDTMWLSEWQRSFEPRVAVGFYVALNENARRFAYRNWGDCLGDGMLMNRSLEALGAKRYKPYRIYEWN